MDCSAKVQGTHATPSPSCACIASVNDNRLRVSDAHAPERHLDLPLRIPGKDILSLKWSDDDAHIAITSAQAIEVLDLNDASRGVQIDNGSGGLGRFVVADFAGSDQLLVLWEFGRARLWNVATGHTLELGDVKTTCTGRNWQRRPAAGQPTLRALATLSRPGAEDLLSLHFPSMAKSISSVKLPSADARALSWSPDGRWLAMLDSPTASSSCHILTPDGHFYRSYPSASDVNTAGLGVKALVWSQTANLLALTKYDGHVVLRNTRSFAVRAIIEHATIIEQPLLPQSDRAPIWQEAVSASAERSYTLQSQPFSLPLSRTKPSTEPSELGVAEACFNSNGTYLATRDEQTLSTVWIWDLEKLTPHTILVQHVNVRRLHWHPSRPGLLMLDCGEGVAYLFDASSREQAPTPMRIDIDLPAKLFWLAPSSSGAALVILAAHKSSFRLAYPEGTPDTASRIGSNKDMDLSLDEDASDDSLLDVLSGRKPLHPKTEPSYTERIDLEVESHEAGTSVQLDDTFVGRNARALQPVPEFDPLDDSQIF